MRDPLIAFEIRVKAEMFNGLARSLPPKRPDDAAVPDVPLDTIPGTYTDPAYGEMVICSVTPTASQPSTGAETLAENPSHSLNASIPTYIAHFPKFWSSHLLFEHHNASTFLVRPRAFYPETKEGVVAQFEWFMAHFGEGGMAWGGNAWGAGPGVEERSVESGLKKNAEVWFEKK